MWKPADPGLTARVAPHHQPPPGLSQVERIGQAVVQDRAPRACPQ
jgi:hypothetical protein